MRAVAHAWWAVLCAALFCAAPDAGSAQDDPGGAPQVYGVEIHGFVSPGFVLSTGNNYFAKAKHGSPQFSEVGINFTKPVTEQLRVGVQLFARDLGPIGNYSAKFDWFYVDYRFRDWLGIRAGRVKIPFGLYNETNDVDAARVPVLLPQSIYPIGNRDYLLAQTGGEVYGYRTLGPLGAVEYRAYGGTIYLDTNNRDPSYSILEFDTQYVVGGRLMLMPAVEGLRLGGSVQALKLDGTFQYDSNLAAQLKTSGMLPMDSTGTVHLDIPATLALASVEYASRGLLVAAEYSRWYVKSRTETTTVSATGEQGTARLARDSTTSERLYGMVSYVVAPYLTPGVYYSLLFPDVDKRSGSADDLGGRSKKAWVQHDTALTLRFDINEFWLFKLEGHYLRGTASLNRNLNEGKVPSQLTRDWLLFLAKTTLYF